MHTKKHLLNGYLKKNIGANKIPPWKWDIKFYFFTTSQILVLIKEIYISYEHDLT